MSTDVQPVIEREIVYPESDGQPVADNTLQFRWIMTIQGGLDALFRSDPDVFVAGDLLWYPVEGEPTIRRAPDILVAFGRPKGDRGSYLQWREDGIAPQVVFEILSPGNTLAEMGRKFQFYDIYGVEEYYIYDPDRNDLNGWRREDDRLRVIDPIDGWSSPRLGIRFVLTIDDLLIYRPDGQRFLSYVEIEQEREQTQQLFEQERVAREQTQQLFEQERVAREQAQQRANQLIAQLKALGIEPLP